MFYLSCSGSEGGWEGGVAEDISVQKRFVGARFILGTQLWGAAD